MKIKNKGKVHPSPSSSSSSSSNDRVVVLSVLKLLPAAILALASVLSLEDREVLAYLITRSLKTPPSSLESKKKSSKKAQTSSNNGGSTGSAGGHKPPMFDCDCFDCYTSYWVRWDSSTNRELIHQVIEAFEDHLTNGEKSSSKKINGRGKRRDKLGRSREAQNVVLTATAAAADGPAQPDSSLLESSSTSSSSTVAATAAATPAVETTSCAENAVVSVPLVEKSTDGIEGNEKENDAVQATEEEEDEVAEVVNDDVAVALRSMAASDHKGLARKVLPDVLGLLNSRLWSLWSPNA